MSDAVSEIFASVLLSAFLGGAIVIVCFMIEKWGTSGTKSSALLDIAKSEPSNPKWPLSNQYPGSLIGRNLLRNCCESTSGIGYTTHVVRQQELDMGLNSSNIKDPFGNSTDYDSNLMHQDSNLEDADSNLIYYDNNLKYHDRNMKDHDIKLNDHESNSKNGHDSTFMKDHDSKSKDSDSKLNSYDSNSKNGHDSDFMKYHDSKSKDYDSTLNDYDSNSKNGHDSDLMKDRDSKLKYYDGILNDHDSNSKNGHDSNFMKDHDSKLKDHDSTLKDQDSKLKEYESTSKLCDRRTKGHDLSPTLVRRQRGDLSSEIIYAGPATNDSLSRNNKQVNLVQSVEFETKQRAVRDRSYSHGDKHPKYSKYREKMQTDSQFKSADNTNGSRMTKDTLVKYNSNLKHDKNSKSDDNSDMRKDHDHKFKGYDSSSTDSEKQVKDHDFSATQVRRQYDDLNSAIFAKDSTSKDSSSVDNEYQNLLHPMVGERKQHAVRDRSYSHGDKHPGYSKFRERNPDNFKSTDVTGGSHMKDHDNKLKTDHSRKLKDYDNTSRDLDRRTSDPDISPTPVRRRRGDLNIVKVSSDHNSKDSSSVDGEDLNMLTPARGERKHHAVRDRSYSHGDKHPGYNKFRERNPKKDYFKSIDVTNGSHRKDHDSKLKIDHSHKLKDYDITSRDHDKRVKDYDISPTPVRRRRGDLNTVTVSSDPSSMDSSSMDGEDVNMLHPVRGERKHHAVRDRSYSHGDKHPGYNKFRERNSKKDFLKYSVTSGSHRKDHDNTLNDPVNNSMHDHASTLKRDHFHKLKDYDNTSMDHDRRVKDPDISPTPVRRRRGDLSSVTLSSDFNSKNSLSEDDENLKLINSVGGEMKRHKVRDRSYSHGDKHPRYSKFREKMLGKGHFKSTDLTNDSQIAQHSLLAHKGITSRDIEETTLGQKVRKISSSSDSSTSFSSSFKHHRKDKTSSSDTFQSENPHDQRISQHRSPTAQEKGHSFSHVISSFFKHTLKRDKRNGRNELSTHNSHNPEKDINNTHGSEMVSKTHHVDSAHKTHIPEKNSHNGHLITNKLPNPETDTHRTHVNYPHKSGRDPKIDNFNPIHDISKLYSRNGNMTDSDSLPKRMQQVGAHIDKSSHSSSTSSEASLNEDDIIVGSFPMAVETYRWKGRRTSFQKAQEQDLLDGTRLAKRKISDSLIPRIYEHSERKSRIDHYFKTLYSNNDSAEAAEQYDKIPDFQSGQRNIRSLANASLELAAKSSTIESKTDTASILSSGHHHLFAKNPRHKEHQDSSWVSRHHKMNTWELMRSVERRERSGTPDGRRSRSMPDLRPERSRTHMSVGGKLNIEQRLMKEAILPIFKHRKRSKHV